MSADIEAGLQSVFPLWGEETSALSKEFLSEGFSARIVSGLEGSLESDMVGRSYDEDFLAYVSDSAIDPCGERGEFHTFVTAGPTMSRGLRLLDDGIYGESGHNFLRILGHELV